MERNQEEKTCTDCKLSLPRASFITSAGSDDEWMSSEKDRKCIKCRKRPEEQARTGCKLSLPRASFIASGGSDDQWMSSENDRECMRPEEKTCTGCKLNLPRASFIASGGSDDQWMSSAKDRKCISCSKKQSAAGMWKCVGCPCVLPKAAFVKWPTLNQTIGTNRHTRCDACMDKKEGSKIARPNKSPGGKDTQDKKKGKK